MQLFCKYIRMRCGICWKSIYLFVLSLTCVYTFACIMETCFAFFAHAHLPTAIFTDDIVANTAIHGTPVANTRSSSIVSIPQGHCNTRTHYCNARTLASRIHRIRASHIPCIQHSTETRYALCRFGISLVCQIPPLPYPCRNTYQSLI